MWCPHQLAFHVLRDIEADLVAWIILDRSTGSFTPLTGPVAFGTRTAHRADRLLHDYLPRRDRAPTSIRHIAVAAISAMVIRHFRIAMNDMIRIRTGCAMRAFIALSDVR